MSDKDEITQDEILRGMKGLGECAPTVSERWARAALGSMRWLWSPTRESTPTADEERAEAVRRAAEVEARGVAQREADEAMARASQAAYLIESIKGLVEEVAVLRAIGVDLATQAGSLRKRVDKILSDGQALLKIREKEQALREASAQLEDASDEAMLVALGGHNVAALRAELAEFRAVARVLDAAAGRQRHRCRVACVRRSLRGDGSTLRGAHA